MRMRINTKVIEMGGVNTNVKFELKLGSGVRFYASYMS